LREVLAALAWHAGARPGRVAFATGDAALTYAGLARRVAGAAAALAELPPVIGLAGPNDLDWVVTDLAAAVAGKTLVPLPSFFSVEQIAHVVADAGIGVVIAPAAGTNLPPGLPVVAPFTAEASTLPGLPGTTPRIIYTSGSTGRPKGVCLDDRQLGFAAKALAGAIDASADDRYLSLLPFPLLLESLCGIHVPVLVGGESRLAPQVLPAVLAGDLAALPRATDALRPTITVLVPELLRAWAGALMLGQQRATDSLRVVAVGGAPVAPDILMLARGLGLPAYEGYGLSECCSVVALNRPGDDRPGTAGRPLAGLGVTIADDGEIIVRGPSAMAGYLGAAPVADQAIRTGDIGRVEPDGRLVVLGRKDSVLISAYGRNVSPEWIETMLTADFRVAQAVLTGHGAARFTAVLVPTAFGATWLAGAGPDELAGLVALRCESAPDHARPGAIVVASADELRTAGLLTGNGRPRRAAIQAHLPAWRGRTIPITRKGVLAS
jgi:long-subunit acyl-CoA synthetase (AMP-forming)